MGIAAKASLGSLFFKLAPAENAIYCNQKENGNNMESEFMPCLPYNDPFQ